MAVLLRRLHRRVGMTRRWLFPSLEKSAWRRAWHQAELTPRRTPGVIRMLEYELGYSDLQSCCFQWEDIFVKRALEFQASSDMPRILDCGANIGLASLFFKRLYPSARITAYEADPALHSLLRSNLDTNRAADVATVHAAVWTTNGELTFNCEGSDAGMIAGLPSALEGQPRTVESIRLRDVLEREAVDLLKLDIEGAEGRILEDCAEVLGQVRALVMEVHEFDPCERQTPQVLARLASAGFVYTVDDLVSLTWREPKARRGTPFPGRAMSWAVTVRAWRDS
jgi:FkbM family methyltransferase